MTILLNLVNSLIYLLQHIDETVALQKQRILPDNKAITHNVKKQRCVRNIHESRRRLFSSASGNGYSVCALSQNFYSAKAERIRCLLLLTLCYFVPRLTLPVAVKNKTHIAAVWFAILVLDHAIGAIQTLR